MKKDEVKTVEAIVKEEFGKILSVIEAYLEYNRKTYDEKLKRK